MSEAGRDAAPTFSRPSSRDVAIVRAFAAPPEVVFEAWTDPQHVPNWMLGPEGWSMTVCAIDLRPGGTWRFVWLRADGAEMEMHGRYREIERPRRLVHTERWGGDWPETRHTVVFVPEGAETIVTTTIRYPSEEARDAAMATGMEEGVSATFRRLDEYLRAWT